MAALSSKQLRELLPYSAFGELLTASPRSEVSLQFPYNINTRLVNSTTATGGTVTQANSMMSVACTSSAGSSAIGSSIDTAPYLPGVGLSARFTAAFSSGGVSGILQEVGIGDTTQGFYVGYNGTTFSINRRKGSADNFVAQTAFNRDPLNGFGPSGLNVDFTKINVFRLQMQYLGGGAINFEIEDFRTGRFILFHQIEYAGRNTGTSIDNPTLNFCARCYNAAGAASGASISVASAGLYLEGLNDRPGVPNGKSATKSSITSEIPLISIRNDTTFVGKTNKSHVHLKYISLSNEGSQSSVHRILLNATLTGPAWTNINSSTSLVSYDTTASAVSGGIELFASVIAKSGSDRVPLDDIVSAIQPGQSITITAASSGGSSTCGCGLAWKEIF